MASSMTLDVPLLGSDTPGVANVLHFNNAVVRASVHYYNDEAEAERFVRAVGD
jgi:selenocysteine lyase/cysteine desulfurase